MATDTSATVTIHGSPWKLLLLAVLGLGMTGLCLALAVPLVQMPHGIVEAAIGWIGTLFFGAATAMIIWRAVMAKGPVVTMTPGGIRDVRVATGEIPWSAIRGISTWSYQGQQIMVLDVLPEVEAGLGLSPVARMTRTANRLLGADGLCVTAQGLEIGYDEMMQKALAYHRDHAAQQTG